MKSLHDEKLFSTFCHRFPKPNASMGIMKLTVTYKILVAFVWCTICTQSINLNTPKHQYIYPSNKSFYPSQNVFLFHLLSIFIDHVWICVPNATQAKVIFSCARSPYSLPDLLVTGFRYLRAVGAPPNFGTALTRLWYNFDTTLHTILFCVSIKLILCNQTFLHLITWHDKNGLCEKFKTKWQSSATKMKTTNLLYHRKFKSFYLASRVVKQ